MTPTALLRLARRCVSWRRLLLLAACAVLCTGCELISPTNRPVLDDATDISPASGDQGTTVTVTLTGTFPKEVFKGSSLDRDAVYNLAVDGKDGGDVAGITVSDVTPDGGGTGNSYATIKGTLHISGTAEARPYQIRVVEVGANVFGTIATREVKEFVVNKVGATGPHMNTIEVLANGAPDDQLVSGTPKLAVRTTGTGYVGTATVLIAYKSETGPELSTDVTIASTSTSGMPASSTLSPVTVPETAQTGRVYFAVQTANGVSNRLPLTVAGRTDADRPRIDLIDPIGVPNSGIPPQVKLTGINFLSGAELEFSDPGIHVVTSPMVADLTHMSASIAADHVAPGTYTVKVNCVGLVSDPANFEVITRRAFGPEVFLVTPNSGVAGTRVWVLLQGRNFSPKGLNTINGNIAAGLPSVPTPGHGDKRTKVAAEFTIAPGATLGVHKLQLFNETDTSPDFDFTVIAAPTAPTPSLTTAAHGAIHGAEEFDETLDGANLDDGSGTLTVNPPTTGITISNVVVASGGAKVTFHVKVAARSGNSTGDVATNYTVTNANGTSNPIAVEILRN